MGIRIGISGWRYTPRRGVFSPRGLPQRSELEFAARRFPTIELNGSFYSLQTPGSYQNWHDATPEDFVFAVKAPRFLTHVLRLRELQRPLAIDRNRPLRHVLEVRHPSFQQPEFIQLLREHNVALVIADTAGKWPYFEDITTDFTYLRLHGDSEIYVSGYTDAAEARQLSGARQRSGNESRSYRHDDSAGQGPAPIRHNCGG